MRRKFLYNNSIGGGNEDVNNGNYTVSLNDEWIKSTSVSNPDSALYDVVYESYSNYNVNNSCATLTITISGLDTFTLYIRSYAESYYDYVMVSQLDKLIDNSTSYLYNEYVKAHTRGVQKSTTDIYSYTQVVFDNIGGGEHTITVIYRKDESGNSGTDKGYVLISKDNKTYNESGGDSGGDEDIDTMSIDNYLTMEALEDGMSAMLSANNCEYCVDGDNNWIALQAGAYTPSINTGQKISFRAKDIYPTSSNGIGLFTVTKPFNLMGNCMSMLFGDNASKNFSLSGYDYAFYRMFYGCSNLRSVSKNFLPAMALSNNCYSYMFRDCINLITPPNLPSLTLASYCYSGMFYGCTNLNEAPIIAATTLAYQCCYYMFYKCTNLVTSPDLLAQKLASYCYYSMFSQCSNMLYIKMLATDISATGCLSSWVKKVEKEGGIFTKHTNATWDVTGDNGVPKKWTIIYSDN